MSLDTATATAPASASGTDDAAEAARRAEVVREIACELSAELGGGRPARLDAATSLEDDLGFGSLERVELIARVEAALEARLPDDTLAKARTLGDLQEAVARGRRRSPRTPGEAGAPSSREAPRREAAPAASPPPEEARTIADLLLFRAERDGATPHMTFLDDRGEEERVLTYADLKDGAAAVATGLRGLGVPPGGRVAIILPPGPEFFFAFHGAILAGAVPVPLYPPFRADRIAEYLEKESTILRNADPSALLCDERIAPVATMLQGRVPSLKAVRTVASIMERRSDAVARVAPLALALIQYSSGSTGDPKGIELTHANLLANVRGITHAVGATPADTWVTWLPLYHDMGLIGVCLTCLYAGTRVVIMSPVTFLARPERWLQAMHRYRATGGSAPNFAYELCTRRIPEEALPGLDLSSVRILSNGAEPIRPDTLSAFVERFARCGCRSDVFLPCYGLAENAVGVSYAPPGRAPRVDAIDRAALEATSRATPARPDDAAPLRVVGCGFPIVGTDVRIVAVDGGLDPLPERTQGRLLFRGTSATRGYFRRPDATADLLREGGWLDSGDLAYMDGGELFITGRVKDLIIRGGRNIHPADVERAAESVPGVRRGCAAAFAIADPLNATEAVCLVAETRERGAEARERLTEAIRKAVLEETGTPVDRVVLAIPGSVPKTSSGKVRRRECRARLQDGTLERKALPAFAQIGLALLANLPARAAKVARRIGDALFGARVLASIAAVLPPAVIGLYVVRDEGRLRRAASVLARALVRLAGFRPVVRGLENLPSGPAVIVANHASYLDSIVLAAVLPPAARFVAKHQLLRAPIAGRFLRRAGHVAVEREQADRAVLGFDEAAQRLAAGSPVVFFPEGTFRREAGLWPFKLGAFRLAVEAGAPVVPVTIRGTRRLLPDGAWLPRPSSIEVEVGAPLAAPPGRDFTAIAKLREEAAAAIAARLDEPRVASGKGPA